METHRYVRSQLTTNPVDRYNLPQTGDFRPRHRQTNKRLLEYWTNGTTTLLSVGEPAKSTTSTPGNAPLLMSTASSTVMGSPDKIAAASNGVSSTAGRRRNGPWNTTVRHSLMAGSAAGMTATIVCHPFDVLRIKMQSGALGSNALGPLQTFRQTFASGGVRALYTGLSVPLAAQAVYKSTVFTVNKLAENAIQSHKTLENYKLGKFVDYELTLGDRFVSGSLGGAINGALFVTPVEMVRNQMISNQSKAAAGALVASTPGPVSVMVHTVRNHGPQGLWRGLFSTVLRDSIGCGLFFVTMAVSQQQWNLAAGRPKDAPATLAMAIPTGAMAGMAFWLWALPLDTMKTWIQASSARNLRHAWELSQARGFAKSLPVLFRGWQVAYGRGAPSAAITVTTYSLVSQHLNKHKQF